MERKSKLARSPGENDESDEPCRPFPKSLDEDKYLLDMS